MASRYVLTLYGACCALEMFAQARSIEQVAIGTDSFAIAQASATESVPFEVIETKDQYEMRNYGSGDFATTEEFQSHFTVSYTKGLSYLSAYFLGRNKENVRMDRTVPFWTKLYNDREYKSTNMTYQHAFYIPEKYQDKPPEPSSDKVKVVHVPGGRAYTRQFSGFATEGKALEEALRLHDALLEDEIRDFEDHFFWLGVYDPPVKIVDRKNEILVYGKHVDHQSPAKHAGPLSKLLSIFLPVK